MMATRVGGTRSTLRASALLTVGIDVGGTKTACVVTDADDRVLLHDVEPTDVTALPEQLTRLIKRAVASLDGNSDGTIAAVGIAVPGYVEPRSGTFGLAVNLGGTEGALGPQLERLVALPCFVEHDARTAAKWLHGNAGVAADDLAYLSVGTGISAGVVLNGLIFRGANGLAGEVGHVVADPSGPRCACGLVGCLEAVAAGPAIARMAGTAHDARRTTKLGRGATAVDVFRAAAAGDDVATEIATAVAASLARAVRELVLTLGVRHVVIGGGVAAAGNDLLTPLIAAIARERAASPLVEAAFAEAIIELLSPDVEAGARGAAAIARERVACFEGLAITDALDMGAIAQDAGQVAEVVRALSAGEDLLLGTPDPTLLRRLAEGVQLAKAQGLVDAVSAARSAQRLAGVRKWLRGFDQPDFDVVDCAEHEALAREVAERSVTLVRNDGLIPLQPAAEARVAVIQPQPADMTPADTSSDVPPLLAAAIRRRHAATHEFVVPLVPAVREMGALATQVAGFDLVILGTVAANIVPEQAALAAAVLATGRPTVTVALRTPWDIAAYPQARTHICSYGILPATIEALAGALFGERPFSGHLPVEIRGVAARGRCLTA